MNRSDRSGTMVRMRTIILVALLASACPRPIEPGRPPTLVDCTVDAVRSRAIPLIPKVNDCLVQPSDWKNCLIWLIDPVAGITEDALACTVSNARRKAVAAAQANTSDSISKTSAERAASFISERGYTFEKE